MMGFYGWWRDLDGVKKASLIAGTCIVFSGIGYSIYKLYSGKRKVDLFDESANNGNEQHEIDVEVLHKRVLVLGLQGCGKTTFLTALTNLGSGIGHHEIKPTEGFNVMSLRTNGILLNIWEIGGSDKVQDYWSKFTTDTNLLIYMVDSTNTEHFLKAKTKLDEILQDPCLKDVPLILLASKQDKTGAASLNVIQKTFHVESLSKVREMETFAIQIPLLGPEFQGIEVVQNAILKLCTKM